MSASAALYEAVVAGEFPSSSFQAIFDRCQLQIDFIGNLYLHEVVFEPLNTAAESAAVRFMCSKQMKSSGRPPWTFCTQSKPEPARLYPDATVRQAVYSQVTAGDPLAFAAALGYRRSEDIYKRGFAFLRGALSIHIYQYVSGDPNTIDTSAWDTQPDGQWHMEIKSPPIRNTQETPLSEQVDAVSDFRVMMKSLLDLRPLGRSFT